MEQNPEKPEKNIKEERVRSITHLYYSNPEIQKIIFEFSKNREICPRYFEGFGKRPDSFQYQGDVFELVKRGATSFHCSEELWSDALKLYTGMKEKEQDDLRIGWDLLIDIDSKYIDYSKIACQLIIKILKFHGVKNVGIKFSGSKGFHIIVPWKSFPSRANETKTSSMFPEWPRIIVSYLNYKMKPELTRLINELRYEEGKDFKFAKKFIKREGGNIDEQNSNNNFESNRQYINKIEVFTSGGNALIKKKSLGETIENLKNDEESLNQEVIPDLVLVSPRHLFRMPYSLHEKTSLASVVLYPEEIENFQLIDASPMKIKIRNFMPDSKEGEARELLVQALDWHREHFLEKEKRNMNQDFKPLNIKISDDIFPPSIKKILGGVKDGKKRALFVLINFFRSIGMDKDELEKRIYDWNKKNEEPLREGYLKAQLFWSYRNKIVLPPNYDKDYYKGIGVIPTEEELRYKNPVSYMAKKYAQGSRTN